MGKGYEPDSYHRGLRINETGTHTWSVCLDHDDSPYGRFTILTTHLRTQEDARKWIDALYHRMIKTEDGCTCDPSVIHDSYCELTTKALKNLR